MRVEFVSDGQLFLHICVWMCDVCSWWGLFICVYVFAHLYARERLFCPCVLMSVRQEIMCASLRERESVPRSCSARVDEGGGICTPWPQLSGVPGGCLKPFPSFVVHLRAWSVTQMWGTESICMGRYRSKQKMISLGFISHERTQRDVFNSADLCSPPP